MRCATCAGTGVRDVPGRTVTARDGAATTTRMRLWCKDCEGMGTCP